jgi:hypothetical protein
LLDQPGLKVFNTHPLMFALNVPDQSFFQANRQLYQMKDGDAWRQSVYRGRGIRTFLDGVVEHVRRKGYPAFYLYDLHHALAGKGSAAV